MKWLIRAPDHLGDGVMAIPAIQSLAAQFSVISVLGPAWCKELYPNIPYFPPTHRPVADGVILFKPSFGAAWRFRKYPQRIGLRGHYRDFLLTQAITKKGTHRIDSYLAIAEQLAPIIQRVPLYHPPRQRTESSITLPSQAILLIVGTASPQTVRWRAFRQLAQQLSTKPVVFAGGPGDEEALATLGKGYQQLPASLSIANFARIAQQAHTIIGLDSGLSHLAAASRAAIGKGNIFIVYGSTSPERTGPPNSTAIFGKRPDCWPCYAKRCPIQSPCLDTPIQFLTQVL